MKNEKPRVVETKRIYSGWNKLDLLTVEAPDADGRLHRQQRELVDHGDAAVVLVVDRARDVVLLVRQWRAGLLNSADPYLLEACAGVLDPGETPEQTARREAEEELGVTVGALKSLGSILSSPGTLTERSHLFLAEIASDGLRTGGGGNPHEGETIEVVELPLAEFFRMAQNGAIEDAKTLILAQHLMLEARSEERRKV